MIVELAVAEPGAGPYGIAAGPDGAVWVALEIGEVARVRSTGSSDIRD